MSRAAYNPEYQGANWNKFLDRVLPKLEVRGFLQRYLGLSLGGRVWEHKLAILAGEGRNGKGSLYGAVCFAMGDYGESAEPELFTHREVAHPTGQMDLRGLRFVVVSENDKHTRLAEATVKRLTGGDLIKAHYMRKDFVEFQPSHTAVLVTNHLPKVSGDDPAPWSRLRVVPFEVVIPDEEQDGELPEKLELEADAILAWLIEGWKQYRAGGLQEPEEVKAATANYKADSNVLTQFLEDRCHIGGVLQVKVSALWDAWVQFCKVNGSDPGTQREFGQMLDRKGFDAKKGGKGVRYRIGLCLQEVEDDSEDRF